MKPSLGEESSPEDDAIKGRCVWEMEGGEGIRDLYRAFSQRAINRAFQRLVVDLPAYTTAVPSLHKNLVSSPNSSRGSENGNLHAAARNYDKIIFIRIVFFLYLRQPAKVPITCGLRELALVSVNCANLFCTY